MGWFLPRVIEAAQGRLEATHMVEFMGLRCYWHEPTMTLWGCNVLTDKLIEWGVLGGLHGFGAWLLASVFLGQQFGGDFAFKVIKDYTED